MNDLISPASPELSLESLTQLASYAKHLGRAPLKHRYPVQIGPHYHPLKGQGMEMIELRPYQLNDDPRHIDWRVTARTGSVHTRLYAKEIEHHRLLVLDLTGMGYFGTQATFISTRYAQLLALIAWRSHFKHDQLGFLWCFGQQQHYLAKLTSRRGLEALLRPLASSTLIKNRAYPMRAEQDTPWRFLVGQQTTRRDIILCSDRQHLSDKDSHYLELLAKRNQVNWLHIQDEKLGQLPVGRYAVANTNGEQVLSVTAHNREMAQQELAAQQLELQRRLHSRGIGFYNFNLIESPVTICRQLQSIGVFR